jgi:hypothetical protein
MLKFWKSVEYIYIYIHLNLLYLQLGVSNTSRAHLTLTLSNTNQNLGNVAKPIIISSSLCYKFCTKVHNFLVLYFHGDLQFSLLKK